MGNITFCFFVDEFCWRIRKEQIVDSFTIRYAGWSIGGKSKATYTTGPSLVVLTRIRVVSSLCSFKMQLGSVDAVDVFDDVVVVVVVCACNSLLISKSTGSPERSIKWSFSLSAMAVALFSSTVPTVPTVPTETKEGNVLSKRMLVATVSIPKAPLHSQPFTSGFTNKDSIPSYTGQWNLLLSIGCNEIIVSVPTCFIKRTVEGKRLTKTYLAHSVIIRER